MPDIPNPLESAEAFSAYCERVKQQLRNHIVERIAFLQSAHHQLQTLEGLARRTCNNALCAELTALIQQTERELAALRPTDGAAPSDREISALGVPISPGRPGETLRTLENGGLPCGAGLPANDLRQAPNRTAPPRLASPPPVVPLTPSRPVEEIFRDTDILSEEAERDDPRYKGTSGLIRLKGLLCRQRALQAELAAKDIQHWPLRQLMGYLRRRIDEEHGHGHYLITLRAELWPTEAWPWYRLAELYEDLASATDALEWYEKQSPQLTKEERHELLESIAAAQTRLWRHLHTYFPRQNDEHQINLFRDLCAIAEEADLYLFTLQERCPDETLAERVQQLPAILETLRLDREQRARREAALQALRQLVASPDFGTMDDDARSLEEAVIACRNEGIPASSLAFRSLLMDWIALLEESEDKLVQEVCRELQKEAERQARKAEMEPVETERPISEGEQAELDAVRALLRGKRCLFIGGVCREESRQRLERELGLAELVWPSTNGTESVYRFEADIQNTDITILLVRFMRTGWGQARELAQRYNKMFVRLPSGYGLMQVVRQCYRQLLPHEAIAGSDK